jgi:hypothetical protein
MIELKSKLANRNTETSTPKEVSGNIKDHFSLREVLAEE